MSGWPWLGAGWMQHCDRGQFPPGRIVAFVGIAGAPPLVVTRPMAVADMRLPPLKFPEDQHPEKSRLYTRQAAIDQVMTTTEPMTPEREVGVDAFFDELERDMWEGTTP